MQAIVLCLDSALVWLEQQVIALIDHCVECVNLPAFHCHPILGVLNSAWPLMRTRTLSETSPVLYGATFFQIASVDTPDSADYRVIHD